MRIMNEQVLKQLLEEMLVKEFSEYDNSPKWKFSIKHRIAMKRIFAKFERNACKLRKKEVVEIKSIDRQNRHPSLKRKLIIAAVLIFLTAFLVGWVVIFVSGNFSGTVYNDNTHLTITNIDGSPKSIEYKYALVSVPEGFELNEKSTSRTNVYTKYKNRLTGQTITLSQWVKSLYAPHFNTEHHKLEEITVNGKSGLYIDFSEETTSHTLLVWDNEDYIIEIVADLNKDDAVNWSKINKF